MSNATQGKQTAVVMAKDPDGNNVFLQVDSLGRLITAGSGGAVNFTPYEIIFDESAATETDNLKNTFASLMARVGVLSPEPVKVIVRKPGLNTTVSIPLTGMPGPGWDFEKIVWTNSPDTIGVVLDFADGSYVQNMHSAASGIRFKFNETTAPVCSIAGIKIIVQDSAGFDNAGTQPIFQVNGGFLYFLSRGVYAPFQKSGSVEAVDIQSGSMQVDFETQTLTNGFLSTNNQISGPGGSATFNIYTLISGGYNRTDANFSGTTTVNMRAETRVKELAEPAPVSVTADITLTTERRVEASGTLTITLPDPTSTPSGRQIWIKNTGAGVVTLAEAIGGVDGVVSYPMAVQNSSVCLVCNGAQWSVFASHL